MKQPSLFDIPEIHIDKPIRLIELFGGIGAQAMALRDIGANFERWRYVDFDKHAVASYNAIHGTEFKPSDITQVRGADLAIDDVDKYAYILTYSFPCQDLSLAGKQQGMAKGSNTRSCLLWEVERLLNEVQKLPQILLMENVPQVHAEKNAPDFQRWISFLNGKGYVSFWQDLNAKDYGLPQNRNRCFMLSFLGDVDFEFPEKIPLKKVMKDLLEDSVEEKYYINTAAAKKLIAKLMERGELAPHTPVDLSLKQPTKKTIANTIISHTHTSGSSISNRHQVNNGVIDVYDAPKLAHTVGGLAKKKSNGGTQFYQQDRVYAGDIALAQPANLSGGSYKYLIKDTPTLIDIYNKKIIGGKICGTLTAHGNASSTTCGTFGVVSVGNVNPSGNGQNGSVISAEGLARAVTTEKGEGQKVVVPESADDYRVRKLTPRECWRLMGFSDQDFNKAAACNSNTQLYRQAGNSICVNVLSAIFRQLNIKGVPRWNKL